MINQINQAFHVNLICVACIMLIWIIPYTLISQDIEVIDGIYGDPVSYVNVTTNSHNHGITDENGKLDVSDWKGVDTFYFSILGYKDKIQTSEQLEEGRNKVLLFPSTELLDQITISANRWKERKVKVPVKVSTINQEDVFHVNPQTAADLLRSSGHVFIQKSQLGGGSPIIRGFSASRVLLVVDGVRMNNAVFRSGNVQNVISIDPLAIGSTEVIYGPGSVMYGSDAIGGVMQFNTLDPKFASPGDNRIDGAYFTRYSSINSEKTIHVDLSLKQHDWSFLSSASFSDFDHLRMGSNGLDDYLRPFYADRVGMEDRMILNEDPRVQIPTAYNQLSFLQKIKYSKDKNHFFTYSAYFSKTSDIPRYDRHIRIRNEQPQYGEWHYGPQSWLFQNIRYSDYTGNNLYDGAKITLGHQLYEESRITRNFNDLNRVHRVENLGILSANADLRKKLWKWDVYYGAEWIYNDVNSEGTMYDLANMSSTEASDRYPQASWISSGVYLSTKRELAENWLFQMGARWNNYRIEADFTQSGIELPIQEANLNFHAFSGNTGILRKIGTMSHLAFNLSTGMRAPNVDDIGKVFDSAPGIVVVPNPDLKSETAYNAEINYLLHLDAKSNFEASIYYTFLDNAMVRRNYTFTGQDSLIYEGVNSRIQAIQNAASAYVYGIQLGMLINLSESFVIESNLNYQQGEEEDESGVRNRSRHVVPSFGYAGLRYNASNFTFNANVGFQGEISYNDLPITEKDKPELYAGNKQGLPFAPRWWTLNLNMSYTIGNHFYISSGIENLLDKRYRPYSSGIAAPGRNYIIALKYNL